MKIFNKQTIIVFALSAFILNGCVPKNKSRTHLPMNVKSFGNTKTWGQTTSSGIKKDDCVDCVAGPLQSSKVPSTSTRPFSGQSMVTNVKKVPAKVAFSKGYEVYGYEEKKVTTNKKVSSKKASSTKGNSKKEMTKHYGGFTYEEKASDTNIKTKDHSDYMVQAPASMDTSYGKYTTAVNTSSISRVNSSYAVRGDIAIQIGAFNEYARAKDSEKRYDGINSRYNIAIQAGSKNRKPIYRVRIEGFKSEYEAQQFMRSYGIRDAFLVRK